MNRSFLAFRLREFAVDVWIHVERMAISALRDRGSGGVDVYVSGHRFEVKESMDEVLSKIAGDGGTYNVTEPRPPTRGPYR
jgi:hypothetical protein